MIGHVRGEVTHVALDHVVLDVGGFGMRVKCTPATISALRSGEHAKLATSLVVREDSMTLYGFSDIDERDMFELLQTASGVGPKVSQAMLAVLEPERLKEAIAAGDHRTLTTVPGIGRKGADRIILELGDKMGTLKTAAPIAEPWRDQVQQALLGLGWSAKDADTAVEHVANEISGDPPPISELLRMALRRLSKR